MKHILSFSLAAVLVLGLATSAQANNNGCNTSNNNNCNQGSNNNNNCNQGSSNNNCNNGPSNHNNNGCNVNLSCDAGGPYAVNGAPGSVVVQLDGTDAFGALTWHWSTNYPGATFNNADIPNATLTIPVSSDCSFNVNLQLTVTRNSVSKTCCTTVKVRDHVKPEITCPEMGKVYSGVDTSPETTGYATATDNCDQNVHVSYCDRIIVPSCGADRAVYQIERTWKAVDDDCNVAKCVQLIDVVRVFAYMDVLPGVCPNTYNRCGTSTLPIAIASSDGFNAAQIQWCSVRIWGIDCAGGPVAPECFELADVATPFYNSPACNCSTLNGDGQVDLVAKFKRSKLNQSFGLNNVAPGTAIPVVITGRLCNGVAFIAQDCIVVQ